MNAILPDSSETTMRRFQRFARALLAAGVSRSVARRTAFAAALIADSWPEEKAWARTNEIFPANTGE